MSINYEFIKNRMLNFLVCYSQWIHDNIMSKWDNIKKKPLKLIEMFTGYHATKSVIYTAFQNAGIDSK